MMSGWQDENTYLIAMYRQTANVTVSEIEIVWRICEKLLWNSRYAAQP